MYKEFKLGKLEKHFTTAEVVNGFMEMLESRRVAESIGQYHGREYTPTGEVIEPSTVYTFSINGINIVIEFTFKTMGINGQVDFIIDGEDEEQIRNNLSRLKEAYPLINFIPN